ncbi:MAG: hypothetical protein ABIR57_03040 [Aeromicrobium sp.]
MTWDAYNRRKEALREVLAIADRRREDVTATELLAIVEGANSAFADEAELLLDTQMNWYQALSGQMDRSFTTGDFTVGDFTVDTFDLETKAIMAWQDVAAAMPGTRALLDANVEMGELQRAFEKEHELLARAAGILANHPDFIGQGERVKENARKSTVYAPYVEPAREGNFFTRIRDLVA